MPTMRELETQLRNIQTAVRGAMNHITGAVDPAAVDAQVTLLNKWMGDFTCEYLAKAEQAIASKRPAIRADGAKIAHHAYFCYETVIALQMDSGRAQPAGRKWEKPASGVVSDALKAQVDDELAKLIAEVSDYRRLVIEE